MDKYEYLWMCIRGNFMPGDISKGEFSYEEIMGMNIADLMKKLSLTKNKAEYIMSTKINYNIDAEYEKFMLSGVSAVTVKESGYPDKLRNIETPPYALFYYGSLPEENVRNVAVIGSRNCSEYGRFMAEAIADGLARGGINIISGMAGGIDGIAQAAALSAGGKSYGIVGSGVDICYPKSNRFLYERLRSEGGVISEYPVGFPARADSFPMRNRIISGLSDIVIVVEAKNRSGTFITVDYALSQGKEIMIVPGRATDPLSVGCNELLSQGAHIVQRAEDVLDLLDTLPFNNTISNSNTERADGHKVLKNVAKNSANNVVNCSGTDAINIEEIYFKNRIKPSVQNSEINANCCGNEKIVLESEENMVYSVLDFYALSPEDIQKRINMDIFEIMSILISLEMKGLIKEKGKNLYVKCR